jgi:hypothetical protein
MDKLSKLQCQPWSGYSVGVMLVRELRRFTADEVRFWDASPIVQLIDGNGLAANSPPPPPLYKAKA